MRETLLKAKEFNDLLIGKIPKDWELVSLEDFVHSSDGIKPGPFGSSITKANYTSSGYRVYGQEQVIAGDLSVGDYFISKSKYQELRAFSVQEKDILLSLVGTTGKVLVIRKPFHLGVINPRLIRLRPDSNITDVEYLKHLLGSPLVRYQLNRIAQGGTMEVLSANVLRRLRLPKPVLGEQRRIAEILDTVDEAIAHTSSLIAKLKQMKAGLLHDLLTRGLDENGELRDAIAHPEQFKESLLGRIPKDWEVKTLGSLGEFLNGLNKGKEDFGFGTKFVNISDVYPPRLRTNSLGRMNASDSEIYSYQLNIGDILLDRSSVKLEGVGYPTVFEGATEPVIFCGFIIRFRLTDFTSRPRFICEQMRNESFRNRVFQIATKSANVNVNQEQLAKLRVVLPSSEEQEQIEAILEAHEIRIHTEEAYRDKLKLQKQGLMQDLLTGRVRVEVKNFK